MRDQPGVTEDQLKTVLEAAWSVVAATVSFLPLGADTASSVYRVQAADGTPYFLKLRSDRGFDVKSLAVPRHLCDRGLPHVFAPLAACGGAMWVSVGHFAATLYPFIEGRSGADGGLSVRQWREFGALMRQVHGVALPPELSAIVPRETFTPSRRSLIPDLETAVRRGEFASPAQQELAACWRTRSDMIRRVVRRADELSGRLRQSGAPMVLCHADMHPWNILIDRDARLWLVDWDEAVLAPKERDLMFAVGGIGGDGVGPGETESFLTGYGGPAVDPVALTYYRYAWAVQDIAAFGEQVLLLPDQSESARRDALRYFAAQFAPGNIVSLALAADATIRA